jgi:hypothetical protein
MTQGDRIILTAQVWAMNESVGMMHDFVPAPDLPDPDSLRDIRELVPRQSRHPFLGNFEQHPVGWAPEGAGKPRDPELEGFFRFTPRATAEAPFLDAAQGQIFSPDRKLLASGHCQLLCRCHP